MSYGGFVESVDVVITGRDLERGFWNAFNRLMREPGLNLTTKIRLKAIFKELNDKTLALNAQYQEEIKDIQFEKVKAEDGTESDGKCLEPEKLQAAQDKLSNARIEIAGHKINAESLEAAKITANDLVVLEPIIDLD
jgi:hypothetical protein